MNERFVIYGHSSRSMAELADRSVDTVFTSPPYWGLREYGGGDEIGREKTIDEYIEALCGVFREVMRVLKPSGSAWVVIGDTYKKKRLCLVPERLAVALSGRGWLVRNVVVWHKTDPLPESVKDRLAGTHERILHLVKNERYYYDLDAIRVPHSRSPKPSGDSGKHFPDAGHERLCGRAGFTAARSRTHHPLGKNPGDVFSCATSNFRGPHPATLPVQLVRPRLVSTTPPGGTVLDPFAGAGTVGVAAIKDGFNFVGYEINPRYVALATQRLNEALRKPKAAAPAKELLRV